MLSGAVIEKKPKGRQRAEGTPAKFEVFTHRGGVEKGENRWKKYSQHRVMISMI